MQQIQVRETVTAAYHYTFGNIGKLVGLVWLPALLTFAGSYVFVRPYLYFMATNPSQDDLMANGRMMLGVYGFYIVAVFLFAMMAAGIARDVLHPDKEAAIYHMPPVRSVLRVSVGVFALLLLSAVVSSLIGTLLALAGKALPGVALDVILLIVALAVLYCGIRLSVFLVPAAAEEKSYGLIRSWQLSKGNFWRIVLILICCALPVAIVSQLAKVAILGLGYFTNLHLSGAATATDLAHMELLANRYWLISGVGFFLTPFAYGLLISPLALVYRFLTEAKEKAATPEAENSETGASQDATDKDDK